jgi:polysaccharide chain length determinant protein (PEP-CTERM system associated)
MTAATIESEPYYLGISDYIGIARRRALHMIVPAALVFFLAFLGIMSISPIYRSVATISVESQQIPTDLVQSTVTRYTDQQIEFIRQLVLTRENVGKLVSEHNLYPDARNQLEQVDRFLSNVEISVSNSGQTQGPALSFDVGFLSDSPVQAQSVVEDLVDLFLQENARSRVRRAAETTAFLGEEAEKIRKDMLDMEQRVAQFKQDNRESMPDVTQMNLSLLERLEQDYSETSQRIEGLRGQLNLLELELEQYRTRLAASSGLSDGPSVSVLQRRYEEFLIDHTEQHPDSIRMRQQLEDAKRRMREAQQTTGTEESEFLSDPTYASYRSRIETIRGELEYLTETRATLSDRMGEIQARIEEAPIVEREFTDLQRNLGNLRDKYEEMKNKELEARIAQNLEEGSKGERFSLLEPPIVPAEPYKPDRLKLLLAAMVFSGAVGVGYVLLLEMTQSGLYGPALRHALGAPPLITVPVIEHAEEERRRKMWRWVLIVAALVMISVMGVVAGASTA